MTTIVGVKFKAAGKVYYFDPGEFELKEGSHIIVETARGSEFGEVTIPNCQVNDLSVYKPLKKVIRIADEEDERRHKENTGKRQDALEQCRKRIKARGLEMKLIDVEYTFDNSKIIFYFTADGRVDFRELVKDLAGIFRMRIELRQLGVRDEAKMLGGIGACGKSLCCHSWLPDFNPVSIKMAKIQGLSLNPAKISGICGRLMCCLKYENDCYCELRKGMPDVGDKVSTPDGNAIVVETDLLKGQVKVRLILDRDKNTPPDEDKLSSDISVYKKSEVRRLERRRVRKNENDDDMEMLSEEVKSLLKD